MASTTTATRTIREEEEEVRHLAALSLRSERESGERERENFFAKSSIFALLRKKVTQREKKLKKKFSLKGGVFGQGERDQPHQTTQKKKKTTTTTKN